MKKVMVFAVGAALLMSSCGSYMATGAYTGSSIGGMLGSAIGGITGGGRGSDWGYIIGMAGGAAVGGAIGNAADKAQQRKIEGYHDAVRARSDQRYQQQGYGQGNYSYGNQDGAFDPNNGGDDRIDLNIGGVPGASANFASSSALVIENVRYLDDDGNLTLSAGEVSRIAFDLKNKSGQTLYHVKPVVTELTGNRHILVSPTIEVESIAPGSGIRYTATVVGDRSLKKGTAQFEVSVQAQPGVAVQGGQTFESVFCGNGIWGPQRYERPAPQRLAAPARLIETAL